MNIYISDLHTEVFKNAHILKTTHVCAFQSLPSGLTWKGYYLEGMWKLITEVNSSPPGQNGCHFTDGIFKCIFLNGNVRTSIQYLLKIVPKGPIDNKSVFVQVQATSHYLNQYWPSSLTHICGTRGEMSSCLFLDITFQSTAPIFWNYSNQKSCSSIRLSHLVITTCHLKLIGSFKSHYAHLYNWKLVTETQKAWILTYNWSQKSKSSILIDLMWLVSS